MHLYLILSLIGGACINTGLVSLTFYASQRTNIYNHHFLKTVSVLPIFCILTYVWHQNAYLAVLCIMAMLLSPLVWPYNHYGAIFGFEEFSIRDLLQIKLPSILVGGIISFAFLGKLDMILPFSFGLPIFHVIILSNKAKTITQFPDIKKQEHKVAICSLYFEILAYSCFLILMFSDYQEWKGILIIIIATILLILLGMSISSKVRELKTIQAKKHLEQSEYKKKNMEGIKTNVELEQKLSSFSSKASITELNSNFVFKSFHTAQNKLDNDRETSAKILTKLSKHLRNIVQFEFPTSQELDLELKIVLDFITTANLVSENQIELLSPAHISTSKKVPSRLLLAFVNTVFENLSLTQKNFSLVLELRQEDNIIEAGLKPTFSHPDIDFKPLLKLSRLNNYLFVNNQKVASISLTKSKVKLTINTDLVS